jgi:molybdate transport system permease protein
LRTGIKIPFTCCVLVLLTGAQLFCAPGSCQAFAQGSAAGSSSPAASADPALAVTVSADGSAAKADGAAVALADFMRSNAGTDKPVDGKQLGYRFPVSAQGAFAAVVMPDAVVVYTPQPLADRSGFQTLLQALDARATTAVTLSALGRPYVYTTQADFRREGQRFRFDVPVEQGSYYVFCSQQAQFVDSGLLVAPTSASATAIQTAPTGLAGFAAFLASTDLRPLWVSLRTALAALLFIFLLGLLAARATLGMRPKLRGLLDALFTIPMVLPPTVVGFLLLVLFGNSTPVGRWLIDHGVALVFSWPAAVLAATVVGFPLMYRTVRGAFEAQDSYLLDAARTLGWGEWRIFLRLMLPLAWPSIAAGTVLAFARALGEFGATLFVAGNYAGVTQTIPIAIYFDWMGGDSATAVFWVVVVILISFLVILLINWYAGRTQRYKRPLDLSSSHRRHATTAPATALSSKEQLA